MQGFNMGRYHPPSTLDSSLSSNKRKRPPSSSTQPVGQTVRFEMPFAIWCTTCPQPTIIPQGVRFNAHKTREGSYYTTPIWRFSIKHTACGGEVVIRTDPKNTDYEVVEGARRRDYGDEEQGREGQREELRKDAFRTLEKTIADDEIKKGAEERIEVLQDAVDRDTWDPYARNQALRKAFRVGRKEREQQAERDRDLQQRLGTGVELLPESEEDRLRAGIVDFERVEEGDALRKPLFGKGRPNEAKIPKKESGETVLKREKEIKKNKEGFVSSVMGNTRLGRDPFLNAGKATGKGAARLPGVKRKREEARVEEFEPLARSKPATGLVSYDSD